MELCCDCVRTNMEVDERNIFWFRCSSGEHIHIWSDCGNICVSNANHHYIIVMYYWCKCNLSPYFKLWETILVTEFLFPVLSNTIAIQIISTWVFSAQVLTGVLHTVAWSWFFYDFLFHMWILVVSFIHEYWHDAGREFDTAAGECWPH